MHELILATSNKKKVEEMRPMLAPLGISVRPLKDFPDAIDVEETGETFLENARLKAVEQAVRLGRWCLAEDSGLAIDALDGGPGVYSARFAGEPCDDDANNQLVLERLSGVPESRRGGGYVCQMVLADPAGEVRAESRGTCRGRIATELRGTGGFGYDPLFLIPEYHKTFGELGMAVKAALSHRARAARQLLPQLAAIVRSGQWENSEQ